MSNIRKMFICSCGLEGIMVEADDEYKEIYLSCYVGSGFYAKQNSLKKFFKRFKIAWKILLKGEYKFYEIILTNDTAKDLAMEILKLRGDK